MLGVLAAFINSTGRRSKLPVLGSVKPFTLTNQLGEVTTLQNLKGKVWVADIIFVVCPGPCPKMTEEMSKLQTAFDAKEPVRFVTLTTFPEHDTPEVLKTYSEKFSADPARWYFLTGSKQELLANLAIKSLMLSTVEKEKELQQSENDRFIHTTKFVLVDKTGKIRGYYDSLEPPFQETIRADIKSLLAERP